MPFILITIRTFADLERELLSIDRDEKKLIKEIKDAARCTSSSLSLFLLSHPASDSACLSVNNHACMQQKIEYRAARGVLS